MKHRQKWEISHDVAHAQLDAIERAVAAARDALQFFRTYSDSDHIMIDFIDSRLHNVRQHTTTARNHIDRLADSANPNAQQELPF